MALAGDPSTVKQYEAEALFLPQKLLKHDPRAWRDSV